MSHGTPGQSSSLFHRFAVHVHLQFLTDELHLIPWTETTSLIIPYIQDSDCELNLRWDSLVSELLTPFRTHITQSFSR